MFYLKDDYYTPVKNYELLHLGASDEFQDIFNNQDGIFK